MKRTLVNTYKAVATRIPKGTPVNMRFANLPPTYIPSRRSYLIGDARKSIQLEDFDMVPGRGYFFVGTWKFGLIAPWFGFNSKEIAGVDVAIAEDIVATSQPGSYTSAIAIPGTHMGMHNDSPALYAQSECGFTAVDDLFSGTIYEFAYCNPHSAYAGGVLSYGSNKQWGLPIAWPLACRVDNMLNSYYDRCTVEIPMRKEGPEKFFATMFSPEVEQSGNHPITVSHNYISSLSGQDFSLKPGYGMIEMPASDPEPTVAAPEQAAINKTAPAYGFKSYNVSEIPGGAFANYPAPVTATLLRIRTAGRVAGRSK